MKTTQGRFSLFIAWRYLFAKKSHHAINIITMVSILGIAVGTMALVVVLSVFNGFETLIRSFFTSFHPELEITLTEGKTFSMDDFPMDDVINIPGIIHYSEVLEETGMIQYRGRQHLVTLKGVDENYHHVTRLDTLITEGDYILEKGSNNFIIPGRGAALMVSANLNDMLEPIDIFLPRRGRTTGMMPAQAFNTSSNFPSGIFAVQGELDMEYVIVPIRLMRRLLVYDNQVTALALKVENGYNPIRVQKQVEEMVGPGFRVRNSMQQQAFIYKVMRSEKWAIFFILSFILLIAAFNIVGSLTMLVIEKRRDISVLRSMGASKKLIHRIFLTEGALISVSGALGGILAGGLIAWAQNRFGLISLQAEGTFIINTYPIQVNWQDLVLVFFAVFSIGMLASSIPVQKLGKTAEQPPSKI